MIMENIGISKWSYGKLKKRWKQSNNTRDKLREMYFLSSEYGMSKTTTEEIYKRYIAKIRFSIILGSEMITRIEYHREREKSRLTSLNL